MSGTIIDCIELKGRNAQEYGASGLVIIVDRRAGTRPMNAGESIVLVRADGWLSRGIAEDVRAYGDAPPGLFLRGLTRADVPIGAELRWGDELWPSASAVA